MGTTSRRQIAAWIAVACFATWAAPLSARAQVSSDPPDPPAPRLVQPLAFDFGPLTPSNALGRVDRFDPLGQVVTQPAGPPPTPRHTGIRALFKDLVNDVTHLPSKENLFWVGVGGGLALAAHPADDSVHDAMVDSDAAHRFFKPGAVLGELPTLLSTAVAIYAFGRIKDQPKVSHLGMDLIEALVISEGLTQVLKVSVRRERPDGSTKNSFPSGHAADTFAFATALERHLGWKGAVPAYIFSSYVAISRLPANRHFLSDAVFGAAVGIIAGRTVTRHGRAFPVALTTGPGGRGFAISYVHARETHEARSRDTAITRR